MLTNILEEHVVCLFFYLFHFQVFKEDINMNHIVPAIRQKTNKQTNKKQKTKTKTKTKPCYL